MEIVTPRWVYCVSAGQDEVGKWKAHDVAGAWCNSYLHTAALRAKCRPDSESDVFQDRATLPQLNFHHAGSQDQRSLAFGYSGPKWCPVLLRVSGGRRGVRRPHQRGVVPVLCRSTETVSWVAANPRTVSNCTTNIVKIEGL